jgi:hypothetical protein
VDFSSWSGDLFASHDPIEEFSVGRYGIRNCGSGQKLFFAAHSPPSLQTRCGSTTACAGISSRIVDGSGATQLERWPGFIMWNPRAQTRPARVQGARFAKMRFDVGRS